MKKELLTLALATVVTVSFTPTITQAAPAKSYETGIQNVARITKDLHEALDADKRETLYPIPVLVEQMPTPYLQPSKFYNGKKMYSAVHISQGFVDLINSFSHAIALEDQQRGSVKSYLAGVSAEQNAPTVLPVSTSSAWSLDTMNAQHSHFNQIAGTLVAIDMADHYLGYYKKYGKQLGQSQTEPINNLLTAKEWRLSVLHGAKNALQCGLGVDGLIEFYKSIDNMKNPPSWTEYFVPEKAKVSKVCRDLKRLETHFFAGREFKF